MGKNLVIVESPAKAKTIENYLGEGFIVKSSYGHVRDLPKKGVAVDVENDFEPNYEVSDDKKDLVKELKKIAKDAELVWLATDEDREGEAISWHLLHALQLQEDRTKRITFNEITKGAITKAIENPRGINYDLVNAQQARRVLDRLVGFELSPVLWKKVKPSLSAGRVQSVAVRLIVERERSIQEFTPTSFYKVVAFFDVGGGKEIKAELPHNFEQEEEAQAFLEKCASGKFEIESLETKPLKRSAAAPFTTSTLQQEASRKLGYSVSRTMSAAQKLYESGKITYMRTDSVNLSQDAIDGAKNEILAAYGERYSTPKNYTTNKKGAQEAHEAIRPTNFAMHTDEDGQETKLYELIWKRAIASQMSQAEIEKTTVKITVSTADEVFQATGEVLKFDGFLKVYLEGKDDEDDEEQKGMLPPLEKGQVLGLNLARAIQRFTKAPARFAEASLVKKLEELGIGRPSTYAPTISTVQNRGYVVKESREGTGRTFVELELKGGSVEKKNVEETFGTEKNKLFPTDIGIVVNDFLVEHFQRILDYNFTANVEKEFDDIASGMIQWRDMIRKFYDPFHNNVEDTLENSERATGERILGEDPVTGKPVLTRIGRFGPMVQIGEQDDEEKPRFASLRKDQSIGSITLEEALDLFKLPRSLGEFEEEEVTVGIGKYGPYVRHKNKFVSIKEDDPMEISLERACELIEQKREEDKKKFIKSFPEDEELFIMNGPYGAYIKKGRKNYRLPKGLEKEPADLTLEECMEIIEKAPASKRGGKKKK